jgi:hypothetical protein
MAKRSAIKRSSEQRVKVAQESLDEPAVRLLQLQYPANVKYQSRVTGEWYLWAGAGAIVPVHAEDADYLLTKMVNNQPCCNSANKPQPKFVEV